MATTKTTEQKFDGTGSRTVYPFAIEYLTTSDLQVFVNNELQTETTHYSISGTNLTFVTAPESGTGNVRIARSTAIDKARAVYAAGSSIRAIDLTNNQDQVLFGLQEFTNIVNNDVFLRDGSKTLTGSLVFEGSTDDDNETTISVTNPTADRTITIPDITGTVITSADTGTVNSTMITNNTIVDADINSSANINGSKLLNDSVGLTKLGSGALPTDITIASGNIVNGTIIDEDINASAAIAGTKITPDFGSQTIQTTGNVFVYGTSNLGDVNIISASPNLVFRDSTSSDPDYEILVNSGAFRIRDKTANTPRLVINSDGEVRAESGFIANGGSTLNGGITVNGTANFSGNLDAGSGLDVTGDITATNRVTCSSITISDGQPGLIFEDTGANPDFILQNRNGTFAIRDTTNNVNRFLVNAANGDITVTGTVDGVDIAARDTLFGGLTSSSGVLTNGVTATTQSISDNSTKVATTAFAQTLITDTGVNTKLPLAGGTLTGNINISTSTPRIFFLDNQTADNNLPNYVASLNNGIFKISETNLNDDTTVAVDRIKIQRTDTSPANSAASYTREILIFDDVTIKKNGPSIILNDTGNNSDYRIRGNDGAFIIQDFDVSDSNVAAWNVNASYEPGQKVKSNSKIYQAQINVTGGTQPSHNTGVVNNWLFLSHVTADARLKIFPNGDVKISENLLLPDSSNISLGSSEDLIIVHDGTDSKITNKRGNLIIEAKDAETGIKVIPDNAIELYFNAVKKLETTSSGVTVTGDVTTTGKLKLESATPTINLTDTDGDSDFQIQNSDGIFRVRDVTNSSNRLRILSDGTAIFSGNLNAGSGFDVTGDITATGNIDLPDDSKIIMGTGDDFELFHDGSSTRTKLKSNNGSLDLIGDFVRIKNSADDEFMLSATANSDVLLFSDGVLKANTLSTGFEIRGDLKISGDITSEDKFITLANITTPTDSQANNSGLYIKGSTDKHFRYQNANNSFNSTENITFAADKKLRFQSKFEIFNSSGIGENNHDSGATNFNNNNTYSQGDKVKKGHKVYEAQANISSGQGGPTHTEGTVGNWSFLGFVNATTFDNSVNYTQHALVLSGNKIYQAQAAISSGAGAPTHANGTVSNWLFVRIADGEEGQYIKDASTGPLKVLTSQLAVKNANDNKISASFEPGGGVYLFHNNVQKFFTTNTGVKVKGGILFNDDTADDNLLDDYEEGTWTPTVLSEGNIGTPQFTCTYTKIGRLVTISADIHQLSDTTSNTNIRIGGLPFVPSATSGNWNGVCHGERYGGQNIIVAFLAYVSGAWGISFLFGVPTGHYSNVQHSDISDDGTDNNLRFTITYELKQ
ncbi:phage tail fiber protein [Hyphomonas sp.]|uniref:phage tail fiber domain-containing protein n=1 Tax=Hyphomonas sp. TaxID=87 RepID=UPI000C8D1710|nr:phage tail fiber protein [Hyphomonas sp.]MAL42608.1 hypothetical protein [Hyphomonas sp.]